MIRAVTISNIAPSPKAVNEVVSRYWYSGLHLLHELVSVCNNYVRDCNQYFVHLCLTLPKAAAYVP